MSVEIDEARRDDESRGIDHAFADKHFGIDGNDAVARDPDVPDSIERGLRVDHPTTVDHDVVGGPGFGSF